MKFEHSDFNNLKPTQNQGTFRKACKVFRCDVLGFFIHIVIVSTTFCFVLNFYFIKKTCKPRNSKVTLSYLAWRILAILQSIHCILSWIWPSASLSNEARINPILWYFQCQKKIHVRPFGAKSSKCQGIIYLSFSSNFSETRFSFRW
jgi:hypothetical protein